MRYLLAVLLLVTFGSCEIKTAHHKKYKIHRYRQHQSGSSDVYWYFIWSGNNTYYYNSPTPVTSFTSVMFTPTQTLPVKLEELEEEGTQVVDETELQEDIEADMSEESGTSGDEEVNNASEEDNSSSPDSESTDGGSTDGGDGGGE
jgi:hypothetical protein